MKGLTALILALVFVLAGCGSRISKNEVNSNAGNTVNTYKGSEISDNSTQINTAKGDKTNSTTTIKETKPNSEKSSKLQVETEKMSEEIDKLLDSLEDIDESNFNF